MSARLAATHAKTSAMRGIRVAGVTAAKTAGMFVKTGVIFAKTVATTAKTDEIGGTEITVFDRAKFSS